MKTKEVTSFVENLMSKLPENIENSVFGPVSVLCTNKIKIESKLPKSNRPLEFSDDLQVLFEIKHSIFNDFFQEPLIFSIGRQEIWISTFYHSSGGKEKDVRNHPFVLSWERFLEENKLTDREKQVGFYGHGCVEVYSSNKKDDRFESFEKGLDLLVKWIDWIKKYSK